VRMIGQFVVRLSGILVTGTIAFALSSPYMASPVGLPVSAILSAIVVAYVDATLCHLMSGHCP
jgi:hypothetical protein